MNEELTGWFPGDVKPVREGVYEREYYGKVAVYSLWNGAAWMVGSIAPHEAAKETQASTCEFLSWRGLAKEPK